MKIELVRHFKVDYQIPKHLNSEELIDSCKKYDTTNIVSGFSINNKNDKIYTSSLIRTHETANYLTNKNIIIKEALIDEVDLYPFINTNMKLPLKIWAFMRDFCWKLNTPIIKETKKDTKFRINKILDKLEEQNEDVTLVGHAVFFSKLLKVLKKRKYKGNYNNRFFDNGEIREFIK